MYGALLPKGPTGQVGAGLGQTTSTGTVTLIPPTVDITHTGQEDDGRRHPDGVPAHAGHRGAGGDELLFPDRRALCMAENATHNLHNVLTLRGALVRDPHGWAAYLDEAIDLFGGRSRRAVRPAPLAALGNATGSSTSWRSSATSTATSTTRRCGCSTRATSAPRSPSSWSCRRASSDEWHCRGYYGSRQPQRQGGLPALPRLVRRQPGAPVAASAARPRRALRRVRGRRRRRARARPRGVRARRLPLGRRGRQPPRLRRPRQRRGQGAAGAARSSSSATAPRTATWRNFFLMGAHELRDGGGGTAARLPRRLHRQPHRSSSSSTRSRSRSTGRAPATAASRSTGASPTPARSTA